MRAKTVLTTIAVAATIVCSANIDSLVGKMYKVSLASLYTQDVSLDLPLDVKLLKDFFKMDSLDFMPEVYTVLSDSIVQSADSVLVDRMLLVPSEGVSADDGTTVHLSYKVRVRIVFVYRSGHWVVAHIGPVGTGAIGTVRNKKESPTRDDSDDPFKFTGA